MEQLTNHEIRPLLGNGRTLANSLTLRKTEPWNMWCKILHKYKQITLKHHQFIQPTNYLSK